MSKKENKIIVFYNEIEQRNKYKLNGVDVTETIEMLKDHWEREIVDTKCKLFQLDLSIHKKYQDQLALTEKALELACERLKNLYCSDYCGKLCDDWGVTEEDLKQECKLYYKCWNKDCILEQAKEIMKSE